MMLQRFLLFNFYYDDGKHYFGVLVAMLARTLGLK